MNRASAYTRPVRERGLGEPGRLLAAGLFVLSLAISFELARPFHAGPVAPDVAAAVLHFDRIVAGHHLEAFLPTTPKPLLTLVYGLLHALTHDWRPISWLAILVTAVAVVLAAELARRTGGLVAAAFVGVGLAGAPAVLFDTGFALAIPWAMLGWLGAAYALTAPRPRYGLAGLALAVAALARVETLVVVGLAAVALVTMRLGPARLRRPMSPGAWLVLLGFAAVPVMLLHDWLLTGDPLFWTTVAVRYSEAAGRSVEGPAAVVGWLGERYVATGGLSLLGILGWLRLARSGNRPLALGLFGLGPGIAALLVALAARGVVVPERYAAPIDIAVVFAAGIGVAGLAVDLGGPVRVLERLGPAARGAGPAITAALAAVVLGWPWGPADTTVRADVDRQLWLATDAARAEPVLRRATGTGDGSTILVPRPLRALLAVDLELPLTRVLETAPDAIDPAAGYPAPGEILFHDRRADGEAADTVRFAPLETTERRTAGPVTIVPLGADPERGWWVVAVRRAG